MVVSYTVSPFLKKELETLGNIRDVHLLELLSFKEDLKLTWDAHINRIYYAFLLSGQNISRKEIIRVLTLPEKSLTTIMEKNIRGYANALEYIKQDWTNVMSETVSIHTLIKLFRSVSPEFDISNAELSKMLSFLQVNPEPPIIQAAIGFVMLYSILGKQPEGAILAILLSYLFLFKSGYHFRNMLVLEEHLAVHKEALNGALIAAEKAKNLSPFLDFFIFAVEDQAKKALSKTRAREIQSQYPKGFFELTERQKQILLDMDRPGSRMTNKIVQKQFKISQITASRELSRLASLGLIFINGKGRSIYYTKA